MAKISVNQLAKFLTSNSAKHQSIIRYQIRWDTFKVNYYEKAKNAIVDFLLGNICNDDELVHANETLGVIKSMTARNASLICGGPAGK